MEALRIIHQLARCGGTVINRCLGCLPGVVVLSEIHPRMGYRLNQFHALVQAHHWFGLLSDADMHMLEQQRLRGWPDWSFTDTISLVHERAAEHGARLAIREYSNADFILTPRTDPVYRSRLQERLRGRFSLLRTALVRHPLEHWRSVQGYRWSKDRTTLEDFLKGCRHFAELSAEVGFVRYEDFCGDPDTLIQELCQRLQLPFDPGYRRRRAGYTKVTGDVSRQPGAAIRASVRAPADPALLERLHANEDYRRTLALLGYT